jgi:drug/metabolite transporter (DMT)-like permease
MEIILLAIIIAIIWGINPVLQKKLLNELSFETVFVISGILYFFALMIYLIINRDKIEFEKIDGNKMKIFIAIMLFTIFSTILYFYLLKKDKSSNIIILTSIYPLFTVIFANAILGEETSRKLLILMSFIILGVIFLKTV